MAIKKNLDILIRESFYDEIISSKWSSGQSLNIDELAEQFGISRTPVTQALKSMSVMRMVDCSSAGHYSILSFDKKQGRDILDVRLMLEQEAVNEIEKKEFLIDRDSLYDISQKCIESNKSETEHAVIQTRRMDLDFHRTLVAQARNECLSDLYHRVQGQFMVANYLLNSPSREQQMVAAEDHEKILIALSKKDYEQVHSLLKAHIDAAYQKILKKMSLNNY
ncbi:MAG: GntR family transcriptional regulator [Spirochaetales bacterium]|nr:GntR family transcriptional regulator [Spirochaetales bacterium]